jgi:hypothetical protein
VTAVTRDDPPAEYRPESEGHQRDEGCCNRKSVRTGDAKPKKTTLPVMFATNTWPKTR